MTNTLQSALIGVCGKMEDFRHPFYRKFSQPLPPPRGQSREYGIYAPYNEHMKSINKPDISWRAIVVIKIGQMALC